MKDRLPRIGVLPEMLSSMHQIYGGGILTTLFTTTLLPPKGTMLQKKQRLGNNLTFLHDKGMRIRQDQKVSHPRDLGIGHGHFAIIITGNPG